MTEITAVPTLPPRPRDGHKGTFGRVLVIAGSRGMSGTAVLCGSAALKGGAGLVTVMCPESIQDIVAAGNPCYMTTKLDGALHALAGADVVAIGPGLGSEPFVAAFVKMVAMRFSKPIVIDADALNALSPFEGPRSSPTILTPHPGEFARLRGEPTPTEHEARREAAIAFAKKHHVVLLLKGHRTIVTDGERVFINFTGNPGMATGGTGDVLTGLIAALLGQGLAPFDAAVLGAHLHGVAGDLAAKALGEVSMTALDLLQCLPQAFMS